jgi:hypothetical protein
MSDVRVYLCFEPDQAICAERLGGLSCTNADVAAYNARTEVAIQSPAAEPIKERLREQIHASDVLVCIISQTTFLSAWINWEIETAKARKDRRGMVGILLHEFDSPPAGMVDAGSIFVPFKRDAVEQGLAWAAGQVNPTEDYFIEKD